MLFIALLSIMKRLLPKVLYCIVVSVLAACVANAEPIFYKVSTGENDEGSSWHTAKTKADFNSTLKDNEVFEHYSVTLTDAKIKSVERVYTTPSGDWGFNFVYHYDVTGVLTKVVADYWTHKGHDSEKDDFFPTRSLRVSKKSTASKWTQFSEKITDLKSGKEVKRTFRYPEVKHWVKVKNLPAK